MKPIPMWAGFLDGEIDLKPWVSQLYKTYGILYRTRREARVHYDDVRRVEVREVKRRSPQGERHEG